MSRIIVEYIMLCFSVAYPDQASVWHAFDNRFGLLFSTLTYAGVFRDYFWRTLLDFYEDNVMYVEIRGVLPPVRNRTDLDLKNVATSSREMNSCQPSLFVCSAAAVRAQRHAVRLDAGGRHVPRGGPGVQEGPPRLPRRQVDIRSESPRPSQC